MPVTITEQLHSSPKKLTFAWTSDGAGAASGQTTKPVSGKVEQLVTVPAGGGVQPTNLYDVALVDEDGVDVLAGAGVDRSNVNTQQVLSASLGIVADDKLTLNVSNAGAAKSGTVHVYLR